MTFDACDVTLKKFEFEFKVKWRRSRSCIAVAVLMRTSVRNKAHFVCNRGRILNQMLSASLDVAEAVKM